MINPLRTPGLRGRLPQRRVGARLPLAWAHEYLKSAIPPPVYPIDVSGGITDWLMLGNDQYGDCGEAGQLHYQMAAGAAAGQIPQFSDQGAIAEYLAYTGGADQGVVLADFLLWLYRKGEILGFAPVDLSNRTQADSLMALFHGLYVGVSLTDDAEQLFSARQPWTIGNGESPDSNMGHCILKVKAQAPASDPASKNAIVGAYVTWGALQEATQAWSAACEDEAWVAVTTQDMAGKFTDALFADINALGGTGSSAPIAPSPQGSGCNPFTGAFWRGILGSGGG